MINFECNHCKKEIDIQEHELYELYSEDCHQVECPYCDKTIYVNAIPTFIFEVTDENGDELIDED